MTFKKYNHTNNAFCELLTDLQSSDTTMILQGNYNRLPTSNFIVKISKYQSTKCVARENIYVANRNDNICTGLVRAYEKVPMNDDATEGIQQALNFSAGDMVECVVSSEVINDLKNGIISIPKDLITSYSTHQIKTLDGQQWISLGRFNGYEASRIHFRFLGGAGFSSNSHGESGVNEIILTIGNETHRRNLTGYWFNVFGAKTFGEVRVYRVDNLTWEIGVFCNSWAFGTMVQVSHSGNSFTPHFYSNQGFGAPLTEDLYQIPEFRLNGMDIHGLPEIVNSTSAYDFFVVKEFTGQNKKVTIENLRKWISGGVSTNSIITGNINRNSQNSNTIAIPNGGIVSVVVNANSDRPEGNVIVYHGTGGTANNVIVTLPGRSGGTIMLPAGYVRLYYYGGTYDNMDYTIQIF